MSASENIRDQNINTHTSYLRGKDGQGRSWLARSPEGNDGVSRMRFSVEPNLTETGITLNEAKLASIQSMGYTFSNMYTALVASDERVDDTKPTGFDSRDTTNRYIQFTGTEWRMSNVKWFDRINIADATATVVYVPIDFRSPAGEMLIEICPLPITDYTEDAPYTFTFGETTDIRYAGDRNSVTRVKQVKKPEHLPDPVNGSIPPERFRVYGIDNNIILSYGFLFDTDGSSVGFFSENSDNNDLRFDIGSNPAFVGTNLGGLVVRNLYIRDENGTATLFDLEQVDSQENSSITFENCIFTNFANIGTIKGFRDVRFLNCFFDIFGTGLVLINSNAAFVSTNRFESRDDSGTIDVSLYGSTAAFTMTGTQFSTADNAHAMFIDPASTIGQGIVFGCPYQTPLNGSFFAAGSLDQKSLGWQFTSNGDLQASSTVGSFHVDSNVAETIITTVGDNGGITAFADAGGGQVTVSEAGHGQSDGDTVLIRDSTEEGYDGLYIISNSTASDYEITATFTATATAVAEYGWTDMVGIGEQGLEIERFSYSTEPNELTYLDVPHANMMIASDLSAVDGSSGKVFEFLLFKKLAGGIYKCVIGSRKAGEFDNRAKGLAWTVPVSFDTGDMVKPMCRNTETTANITFLDFRMNAFKVL